MAKQGEGLVPPAAAQGAAEIGPTYSEEQVTAILQRAAQLERGRRPANAGLTLAEVEAIARDAGLDVSLVRVAAQSLAEKERGTSLGVRVAGAPVRRSIERVVEGELEVSHHERLVGDLRAALGRFSSRGPPAISTVGRTMLISVRLNAGNVEITLAPQAGQTRIRVDVSTGPLAGGLFGGITGGLGGGLAPAAVALAVQSGAGAPGVVLGILACVGGAYALARTIFSTTARRLYRDLDKLADDLARRVQEEVSP